MIYKNVRGKLIAKGIINLTLAISASTILIPSENVNFMPHHITFTNDYFSLMLTPYLKIFFLWM